MSAVPENNMPAWVSHVEILINKALSLDEETLCSLAALQGKVLGFEFINTNLTIFLFPSEKGLVIQADYQDKPDVLIKGTPTNFIKMMASSKESKGTLPTDMQIIGDISLAQRFQNIMQAIEIDVEEPLSKWLGDSMAYQLGKFFRGTTHFVANTGKILANDMSEYLRFEINMLPDDLLVEEFNKEVDMLRDDVDRFEQRLNKLEKRIQEH